MMTFNFTVNMIDYLRRKVEYENLRYTLKLNGVEVETERKMNNPDRIRKSKRILCFFVHFY